MSGIVELVKSHRVVVIYRGSSPEECLEASQALFDAGVFLFEVTLNSDGALAAIELLRKRLPKEASVGAGTVLSAEQVEQSAAAGAEFIISPNINCNVIARTKQLGLGSIPGGFTATEIQHGWELGADIIKVFPINVVGAEYLTQLRGPLGTVPLLPTGKVDSPEFAAELFSAGAVAVGVGAHLLGRELIDRKDWAALQARARGFVDAARI